MSHPFSPQGDSHSDPTRPYDADAARPVPEAPEATNGPAYGSLYGGPAAGAGHDATGPQDVRPGGAPSGTGWGTPYGAAPGAPYGTPAGAGHPGPGAPTAPTAPNAPNAPVESTERSMAMLAHLSMIVGLLLSAGWLTFVGPLVLWFMYKDRSPFVRQAAAGAFNFSIATCVASIAVWIFAISLIGIPVAIVLAVVVGVVTILFPILGAMKADKGQPYRYPVQIPVLS